MVADIVAFIALVRVFFVVVASDSQAATWQFVEQLYAELAAMVDGVHLSVLHLGGCSVDAYCAAIRKHRLHAVACDRHAGCRLGGYAFALQGAAAKAEFPSSGFKHYF